MSPPAGTNDASRPRGTKRRRLSDQEIQHMDPEEMRAALTAAVRELEAHDEEEDEMEEFAATQEQASGGDKQQGTSKVTRTLQMILEELRLMREDRAKDRAEVNELRQEVQCLKAVVTQQQRFAEQLDALTLSQCTLAGPVYTGMPLECHWLTQCTLEHHWKNLVETAPHWNATGET